MRLELYEDATLAHFMLEASHAEYHFSITEAQEIDDAFAIYQDVENYFEILEYEDFNEVDTKTLHACLAEARDMMKDQLRVWRGLQLSDKISLQLQWAHDLQDALTSRFRNLSTRAPVQDVSDILSDMMQSIDGLDHYIAGLNTALLCI